MKMSSTRFIDGNYLPLSSFAQVELGLFLGLHSLPLVQGQQLGLLLPRNLPQDIFQLTIYFEDISTQQEFRIRNQKFLKELRVLNQLRI
jgi:hypothetical protein